MENLRSLEEFEEDKIACFAPSPMQHLVSQLMCGCDDVDDQERKDVMKKLRRVARRVMDWQANAVTPNDTSLLPSVDDV